MATCVVSGTVVDPSETGISGAVVKANVVTPNFNGGTSLIASKEISTTTAASGTWSLTLSQGLSVIVAIEFPPNSTNSNVRSTYSFTVPATTTASFSTLATEL